MVTDDVERFDRPRLSDYQPPLRVVTRDQRTAWMRLPPHEEVQRVAKLVSVGFRPWQAEQPAGFLDLKRQDNAAWILGLWLPGLWIDWKSGQPGGPNVARTLAMANPNPRGDTRTGRESLELLIAAYYVLVEVDGAEPRPYEVVCCDGSTGVPDYQQPCRVWCFDPAAMFHDLGFDLHHCGATDSAGRLWTYGQLNQGYGLIYSAGGDPVRGAIRSFGLPFVARRAWAGRRSLSGLSAQVARAPKP